MVLFRSGTKLLKLAKSGKSSRRGFTVLEFLIVVGIMSILMALILVGLTGARNRATDQKKIANLQTVAVALEQYRDICRVYPAVLTATETCPELGGRELGDLIKEIDIYDFNGAGSSSEYLYVPIESVYGPGVCIRYHLGVELLSQTDAYAARSAKFTISQLTPPQDYAVCGGSSLSADFDGTQPQYYDLAR